MDLKSFLKAQNSLCEFEPAKHQQAVFSMLAEHAMNIAGIHLVYERTPELNKLLEFQGSAWTTLLGLAKDRVIGLFSISTACKYIEGRKKITGYIGDFRTDGSSLAAKIWRKSYGDLLKSVTHSESLSKPDFFLTAILADNSLALRNLVGTKKDFGFYYHFLKKVDMVNVYGSRPFFKKNSALKIRFARPEEEQRLRSFLDAAERTKSFGAVFDLSPDSEWERRKKAWPYFKSENFVIAEDPAGNLLAACLPWSPSAAKRMRVVKAPAVIKLAFKALKLFGYNMPIIGQSIETCYLTHLNIENKNQASGIVSDLLHFLLEQGFLKKNHMLSLADWWDLNLNGFISQRVPVNLYAVGVHKGQDFEHLKTSEIGFEMGLV